jgi:hypothetical protein
VLFPAGFPEAATKLVVKKKFSDFQSLHKSLEEIHKQLYLSGKFPALPKTNKSYFKASADSAGSYSEISALRKIFIFYESRARSLPPGLPSI